MFNYNLTSISLINFVISRHVNHITRYYLTKLDFTNHIMSYMPNFVSLRSVSYRYDIKHSKTKRVLQIKR